MNEALGFKQNIGLVHFHAKRGYAWAQQAGVPLDYEDMFQEASLAFVQAARGFNPDAGVKFSAYYSRAVHSQFSKAVGKFTGVKRLNDDQRAEIAERDEENALRRASGLQELPSMNYGIKTTRFSDMETAGEEGSEPFEQSLMSDCQSPEEIVETKELMDQAMANLSPLATLIVDWLRDPPPELVKELQGQRAHALFADEAGVNVRSMKDGISLNSVKKFLSLVGHVSERELVLAEAELRRAVKYVEEAA